MLHTKFQASEQSGSKDEDFLIFFYVFLLFQPRTPVAGPSWILRPWFEQSWKKTTWQCYISNFKRLTKVVLRKKIFYIFLCISMV